MLYEGFIHSLWPGSFGTVYKAMMDSSQEVAVKVLKVSQACADGTAAKRIKVFVNEVLQHACPGRKLPVLPALSQQHGYRQLHADTAWSPGHMSPSAAGACTTRDGPSPACSQAWCTSGCVWLDAQALLQVSTLYHLRNNHVVQMVGACLDFERNVWPL